MKRVRSGWSEPEERIKEADGSIAIILQPCAL